VKTPRHFLLYRRREDGVIEVGRVLHDSRDLERQLPGTLPAVAIPRSVWFFAGARIPNNPQNGAMNRDLSGAMLSALSFPPSRF
jgi:hypothetical protein